MVQIQIWLYMMRTMMSANMHIKSCDKRIFPFDSCDIYVRHTWTFATASSDCLLGLCPFLCSFSAWKNGGQLNRSKRLYTCFLCIIAYNLCNYYMSYISRCYWCTVSDLLIIYTPSKHLFSTTFKGHVTTLYLWRVSPRRPFQFAWVVLRVCLWGVVPVYWRPRRGVGPGVAPCKRPCWVSAAGVEGREPIYPHHRILTIKTILLIWNSTGMSKITFLKFM